MTLEELRTELRVPGFDVVSTLPAEVYDGLVPDAWQSARVHAGCRSIALVGHSGEHFWNAFQRSPEAAACEHPVDTYTRRVLEAWARTQDPPATFALYLERRNDEYLPLGTLTERAGLGAPSRIGLRLHPTYGPWWALRGVLFVSQSFPFEASPLPSPCSDCEAPCQLACHGDAVGPTGLDLDFCLATRLSVPACHQRCDARLECVVGRGHVFGAEQLAHHSTLAWTPELRQRASEILARRKR